MTKLIQIRNVPSELHRELKVRAAKAGMSLSEYLLDELRLVAEKPTIEEMVARLAMREPVDLGESVVKILREDRESH